MSAARDDYRAAEQRLAEVEEAIRGARAEPKLSAEKLQSLLLQRERIQEESYKAYRRVVGEGLQ